jgi:general secretion pathway protein D
MNGEERLKKCADDEDSKNIRNNLFMRRYTLKRNNYIVSIGFAAVLVLFMAVARLVISADNTELPPPQGNSSEATETQEPKPADSPQGESAGGPPLSGMTEQGKPDQAGFGYDQGGRRGGRSGPDDPNHPRGRRGGNFDMSSMTPEQRQQMMERAGQFMRGMGGGPGSGSRGGDMPGFSGPDATDDPNEMQSLNLNNVEMRNIIKMIGDWTGKAVIPANDDIMQTRITIYCPQKLTKTEALGLIFMSLQSRGVVADQTAGRIILRPLASAKLGAIPTLGVDEPLAKFQDRTAVVEKWFQLQYYNPTNLVDLIKPLVGEHGYVMADQKTGRLAVIDTVDNLSRIEKIVQELDIPESEQSAEQVFEIQYGDPTEMVNVLQLILGGAAGSSGQGFGGRGGRSEGGPGDRQGQSGQPGSTQAKTATSVSISATTTPIRMIPVPKQKWIIVRAGREDMKTIAEWIQKLDMAGMTKPQQSVVPLVYADVTEVVNIIRNTLKEIPSAEVKANVVVEGLPASRQIVIFGNEESRTMVEKMVVKLDMPAGNFFIERTFKLKFSDPDQIKKNIDGLYGETQTQTRSYNYYDSRRTMIDPKNQVKAISYPTLKQVTVIASEQNMEKISKQIEQEWDIPLDIQKDQYRILTLNNSDPVKMTELLNTLFSEEQQSSSQSFFRMLFGEETAGKQKIVGSLYGMFTFEPVPDTKKLIIISKIPEAYEIIERLVNQLDGQEGGEVPRVVVLKYADCEALCDQLNAIFNEPGTPTTIQRSNRGLSSYSADEQGGAVVVGNEGGGNSSSSQITPWWTRQRRDDSQLPPSNLIGQVRFIPVQRSKSILILAPLKYHNDLIKMIEELDLPGMQVMIKAMIVEVALQDNTSLGVMLSSNPDALGDAGVNGATFLNNLQNIEKSAGAAPPTATEYASGTRLDTSVNIYAMVDLLVQKMNGRVLNQPTLWTKDNEEAIFVKGQKVAFLSGDQTNTTNQSSVSRSYTYDNVGVTLRARPNITPEKAVDITINLNISEIETTLINGQNTRKNLDATTHMIVSDGQTIMMGGILFQNDMNTVNKIPLLGDIPILGALFTHTATTLTNSELLVFITPYVFDENMRKEIPAQADHQDIMEQSLNHKEKVADRLGDRIQSAWTDPNMFP